MKNNKIFILKIFTIFMFIIILSVFVINSIYTHANQKRFYNEVISNTQQSNELDFDSYKTYEEASIAFLDYYTKRQFDQSYMIALTILNDYDHVYNLNYKEKIITLFQLYDSQLQYLIANSESNKMNEIYNLEQIHYILNRIYMHSNNEEDMEIISNNHYLNEIFQMSLKYHFQMENLNKKAL